VVIEAENQRGIGRDRRLAAEGEIHQDHPGERDEHREDDETENEADTTLGHWNCSLTPLYGDCRCRRGLRAVERCRRLIYSCCTSTGQRASVLVEAKGERWETTDWN